MAQPISIRRDDLIRKELEADALKSGRTLATYLRELVESHARDIRRARIRKQSQAVGVRAATSPEGGAFYEEWGAPSAVLETKRLKKKANKRKPR